MFGCENFTGWLVDWLIGNTPVDLVVFAFKIWMCVFTSHSIRQYPSKRSIWTHPTDPNSDFPKYLSLLLLVQKKSMSAFSVD